MRQSHWMIWAGFFGAAALHPGTVRADLRADAERVLEVWSKHAAASRPNEKGEKARAERLSPVFAEHGKPVVIELPAWMRAPREEPASQTDTDTPPKDTTEESKEAPNPSNCATVVVLGPRTADFWADVDDTGTGEGIFLRRMERTGTLPVPWMQGFRHPPAAPGADDAEGALMKSSGGVLSFVRCGKAREQASHLMVELVASRAALETIVVAGVKEPPPVQQILPERTAGPVALRIPPGRPVEPGPLLERLLRAEKRARADGATQVARLSSRASLMGAGEFLLRLPEGCHRLDVMAEVPSFVPRRATDIDAEAHYAEGGASLARDRADTPDARLDFCVGEASMVEVPFVGAAGPVTVMISAAHWPIPDAIPSYWGSRARAALSFALRRRNAPVPVEEALVETLGVQGETLIPVAVEPGRCYLAGAGLVRGESRGLRMSVELSGRVEKDEARERMEGVAVAFCAESESSVPIRMSVRGNAPWWILSVWPMD